MGGYDGTNYLPAVLETVDGTHFTRVASLPVPVRYPAVVAQAGELFAFGGETPSAGATTAATNDIQMIDPSSGRATVVGHLPQALYGASAFVIGGTIYVAGGQAPGGITLTGIEAFVPAHRPGPQRRAPAPGRRLRRLRHHRHGPRGGRLHGRRRGGRPGRERPGRRGLGLTPSRSSRCG